MIHYKSVFGFCSKNLIHYTKMLQVSLYLNQSGLVFRQRNKYTHGTFPKMRWSGSTLLAGNMDGIYYMEAICSVHFSSDVKLKHDGCELIFVTCISHKEDIFTFACKHWFFLQYSRLFLNIQYGTHW